ncbi:serpin family protein [Nakamurella sp. A5-74]|uniref:Serpin family protein n=1 Tax=Nakamurella sp. A5-74 TaxID=3158264 RepID=A0AAU8DTZ8_9ACTN
MTTRDIAAALTRRRFLLIATAAATGTLATACGTSGPASDPGTSPTSTPTEPTAAVGPLPSPASSTPSPGPVGAPQPLRGSGSRRAPGTPGAARKALADFGADFLREARRLDPTAVNTAISPYSLFTVLAMARAGAKGATARQIDAALHSAGVEAQGAVISAVDAGVAAAIAAAEKSAQEGDDPIVINTANQTWVQNGYPVHQEYLDALAVQFGVEAVAADFAGDPEGMRTALNAWVAQRTNDLIPELFPPGSIDPSTVVVLVNALYLKAAWPQPLSRVGKISFVTDAGARIQPEMMRSASPVRGASGDGWTAATIPYRGGGAAMTVLVPDAGRFDAVLTALDSTLMRQAAATRTSVQLTMPLLDLKTIAPAKEIAISLGIEDIFGSADLSGIAGSPGDLVASEFLHQAVVKVDEKGTEAAAAAGMAILESSAPMPQLELVVDRPFLFWISESTTGAPLFLGVVTDPSA